MSSLPFKEATIRQARRIAEQTPTENVDPKVEALVNDLIGRVADKWTMIILEVLTEHGELQFSQVSRLMQGVSQKMLTQTLRHMERDGMVTRTVHASVPPRVEYRLTPLGASLGAAFCGVWIWAEENLGRVEESRAAFDARVGERLARALPSRSRRGRAAPRTPSIIDPRDMAYSRSEFYSFEINLCLALLLMPKEFVKTCWMQ